MPDYLIIGSGVAGVTAAETIREHDPAGRITLVTHEPTPFYNRIRLGEYIAGEVSRQKLAGVEPGWYERHRVNLRLSTPIDLLQPHARTAQTRQGETLPWDRLLMATGSSPFIPFISGREKEGVQVLRTLTDADTISRRMEKITHAVILGGGLLGLEAAHVLNRHGKKVTVVESAPRILPRQLNGAGAARLQRSMEKKGIGFRTETKAAEVIGDHAAQGVLTHTGEKIRGQLVLISAGVRPMVNLMAPFGLETSHGIPVAPTMETAIDGLFAAGDCTLYNGGNQGIWPTAMEQGRIAGLNMVGIPATYREPTFATRLKVGDIPLASAGSVDPEGTHEAMVFSSATHYTRMVLHHNVPVGCQMVGETAHFETVFELIQKREPLNEQTRGELETLLGVPLTGAKFQTLFTCTVCGYTHKGEKPPEVCPQCGVPSNRFKAA